MTAYIEGSVQTPTGRIVPMTVHAKPIPEPGRLADGTVIVSGNIAAGVRAPISASLITGRYRIQVYTPAGLLADREMDLKDDQHVTIAELLEPTTPPVVEAGAQPGEPPGVAPAPSPGLTPPQPGPPPLLEGWDEL